MLGRVAKVKGVAFGILVLLFVAAIQASAIGASTTEESYAGRLLISIEGMQQPTLSPNWEKVAFFSNDVFYVANVDGSDRRQIPGPPQPHRYGESAVYAWSWDSAKIAYVNDEGLWIVNADGSNNYRIVATPSINEVLWSPKGRKICYVVRDRNLYLITSDGSDNLAISYGNKPLTWTSDGKLLIDGGGCIYQISEEGTFEEQFTFYSIKKELEGEIEDIVVSIDGSKVAFRCRGHRYKVNFDGSNLQELPGPGCLSPDFRRLVFYQSESVWVDEVDDFVTKSSIWIMDSDGRNQKLVVDFGLHLPEPSPTYSPSSTPTPVPTPISVSSPVSIPDLGWSLDGTKIIYGDGMYDFYVVEIGKAALTTPTSSPTQTITPTSSPTQTTTPTTLATLTSTENPFDYRGEYTLEANNLTDEEKEALLYVMNYANEFKVSPCLILAVIRQESNFEVGANGGEDIGYMQVTYDAAKYGGYKGTEQEWLDIDGLNPDQNIKYGTKYLMAMNYIFSEGKVLVGDLKAIKVTDESELLNFVLAAYNGGAGRIATAQQLCKEAGDDPEKWDEVKNYLEDAGASSEKAEIIRKYVEQVIEGRDLINEKRRGYEFFLTIRVPATGTEFPHEGLPGFEAALAIGGLLAAIYVLRLRGRNKN